MEALRTFLRADNIGRLEFNTECLGACENGCQQGYMSQTGSEIDKSIGWRERTGLDEMKNMANGCGLIGDGLRDFCKPSFARLAELQNTGRQIVQVIIGQTGNGIVCLGIL